MDDQVEIIKSNKGGMKVIHKGYMYTVHKKRQCGGIRWRCAQRSLHCKGSISTGLDGPPKINMPHNHLPDLHSVALARTRQPDNNFENFAQILDVTVVEDHDSMPLMERLLKPNEIAQSQPTQQPLQQPPPLQQKAQILKSQSLSPTKLKVTRQGPKIRTPTDQSPRLHPPAPPPPAEVTPVNEEMCLRWNSHHSNMQQAFPNILNKEQYVDCTLAAEGKTLKCHRMILSSCSPYFEEILSNISPLQHPVLFMKDIPFWILKSLCDFMYAGEVHIYQNRLQELLTVAEMLKIKGLAGKTSNDQESRDNNRGNNDNHGNIKEERRQKKFNYHQHQQQSQQQQQQQFRTGRLINIPPLSRRNDYDNDDVLDPLDLLEPLYEEIADEKKPATTITPATTSAIPTTTTTPNLLPKLQKYQQQFFKKQLPKRMKKRKYSEDRDPSPPPVFSFRKGTRSRPNVKIPKYYHSDYANSKPSTSSQSQQPPPPLPPPVPPQQSDPLLDVDDIKTEPIDVEDNNLSDYNDDTTSTTTTTTQLPQSSGILPETLPSCIEISPQFNNNHNNNNDKFRKIKLTKPIISNVHSIDDHHNNNDNNNNNNNDVDEDDDDDDLHTPLGGLEVIKITMEGNQERINLAVNDLNDVINDIDDDEDDDIDDNDGDDENSKTPPQLTTQSQINNDDDHDNNDTIDMDLEPVQQLENCDNEEISQQQQQQLETNDNDHNHTIEENYEIKDVSDHDQAIEENYEIKNHNHDVENENDTKTDEIIEESPIIHDNVTDVITEQSHNDNDVIDHIIDDINDQTNNNNDDDDA